MSDINAITETAQADPHSHDPLVSPSPDDNPLKFHQVAIEELKAIEKRRVRACGAQASTALVERVEQYRRTTVVEPAGPGREPGDAQESQEKMRIVRLAALEQHLAGITFSGGGIRSATFAVGILQGLASLGLLRRFDYISTVSGGGYAGAWLAAWIKRDGDPTNVERQLKPSRVQNARANRGDHPGVKAPPGDPDEVVVVDEEPEPLHHLREYSSFMMPRPGAFSPDTWAIISIWMRNVLVNVLQLLPLTVMLVLLARGVVWLYLEESPAWVAKVASVVSVFAFIFAFFVNALGTGEIRARAEGRADPGWKARGISGMIAAILSFLAGGLGTGEARGGKAERESPRTKTWLINKAYFGLIVVLMTVNGAGFTVAHPGLKWLLPTLAAHMGFFGLTLGLMAVLFGYVFDSWGRFRVQVVFGATVSGAIGGLLFYFATTLLFEGQFDAIANTVFAPPIALLIMVMSMVAEVAIINWRVDEAEREWWARLSAVLLLSAIAWIGVFGTILYLPQGLQWIGGFWGSAVATGWLGVTIAAVQAGRTVITQIKGAKLPLSVVAAVAPPIFLAGLLCAVSLLVHYLVSSFGEGASIGSGTYERVLLEGNLPALAAVLIVASLVLIVGLSVGDVNLFSLNSMYMNRLVRCYLGASRPKDRWAGRWGKVPDPRGGGGAPIRSQGVINQANHVTGFDLGDDLPLTDFDIDLWPARVPYWGPYPLVNTSLNLVSGQELAMRDRKCASFLFTPKHCGSKPTGYTPIAPTRDALRESREAGSTAKHSQLTLGRVVAISGASIDPNMGYLQSSGLTALLTILNARLGYWVENPSAPGQVSKLSTTKGPRYAQLLLNEFLGRTDENGPHVHLSDGGHFENLGVYELIRRRCRYVVACDAGEDDTASDENLANLVRLVRIDFGVRITLDTSPLTLSLPGRLAKSHVVVGKIGYDDVDNGQMPGILIYIKITMTGDEPSDVQNYASLHPRFPNDLSDLRQIFDEPQFESYRSLGDHIALAVFEDAVRDLDASGRPGLWPDEAKYRAALARLKAGEVSDLEAGQSELDQAKKHLKDVTGPIRPRRAAVPARAAVVSAKSRRDDAIRALDRGYASLSVEPTHRSWTYIRINQQLFASLRNRWSDQVPDTVDDDLDSTKGWTQLHRDLRNDPRLADLSRDLYPERLATAEPVPPAPGPDGPPPARHDSPAERRRVELHAVGQMLQIMEDAWSALRIEGNRPLPMNRGWMNVFRRWANTEAFHRLWPTLCSEFSGDFVEFCEAELHLLAISVPDRLAAGALSVGPPAQDGLPSFPSLGPDQSAVYQLAEEFEREWPSSGHSDAENRRPGLRAMLAGFDTRAGKPLAWLIRRRSSESTGAGRPDELVSGIMFACPWVDHPCRWRRPVEGKANRYANPDALEFFVWIRPVHRSSGIGTRCVGETIEILKEALKGREDKGREVRIRYRPWKHGGGSAMAVAAWRNFFALYNFADLHPKPDYEPGDEQVLTWTVPA